MKVYRKECTIFFDFGIFLKFPERFNNDSETRRMIFQTFHPKANLTLNMVIVAKDFLFSHIPAALK